MRERVGAGVNRWVGQDAWLCGEQEFMVGWERDRKDTDTSKSGASRLSWCLFPSLPRALPPQ